MFNWSGVDELNARRVLQENRLPIPYQLQTPLERHWAQCEAIGKQLAQEYVRKHGTLQGFSFKVETK